MVSDASTTIGGNAEFGGLAIHFDTLTVDSNAYFHGKITLDWGILGDALIEVGKNAIFDQPIAGTDSHRKIRVKGDAWFRSPPPSSPSDFPSGLTVLGNSYFGPGAMNAMDSAAFIGTLPSATLSNEHKKEQAFFLSYENIQDYIVDATTISVGGVKGEDGYANVNVHVLNEWAKNYAPESARNSGFVFIKIRTATQGASKTPVFINREAWASDIILIFEDDAEALWDRLPPTNSDAHLGVWFRGNAAGGVGVDSTVNGSKLCNCFVYYETQTCTNQGFGLIPPIDFRGAMYFAHETGGGAKTDSTCKFKMATNGESGTPATSFTFDEQVMSTFARIEGFIVDVNAAPTNRRVVYDTTRFVLDTLLRATSTLLRVDYMGGFADAQEVPEQVNTAAVDTFPGLPFYSFTRTSLFLPKGRYSTLQEAADSLQLKGVWSWKGVSQHASCTEGDWDVRDAWYVEYNDGEAEGIHDNSAFNGDMNAIFVAAKKLTCSPRDTVTRKIVVTVGAGATAILDSISGHSSADSVYSSVLYSSEEVSSSVSSSSSS